MILLVQNEESTRLEQVDMFHVILQMTANGIINLLNLCFELHIVTTE